MVAMCPPHLAGLETLTGTQKPRRGRQGEGQRAGGRRWDPGLPAPIRAVQGAPLKHRSPRPGGEAEAPGVRTRKVVSQLRGGHERP